MPLRLFESHLPCSCNETIEVGIALFNDANSFAERASFIVSSGRHLVAKHAADWDRGGTIGRIGSLLLDASPVFWATSFTMF